MWQSLYRKCSLYPLLCNINYSLFLSRDAVLIYLHSTSKHCVLKNDDMLPCRPALVKAMLLTFPTTFTLQLLSTDVPVLSLNPLTFESFTSSLLPFTQLENVQWQLSVGNCSSLVTCLAFRRKCLIMDVFTLGDGGNVSSIPTRSQDLGVRASIYKNCCFHIQA